MSDITTRAGKGSPLTHSEVDANFTNLNSDKYQSGDDATLGTVTAQTKVTSPRFENGIFTNDYLYLAGSTTGSALTGGLRFNIGQYGGDYSLTSGAKIESLKTSPSSGIEYLSFFSQSYGSSTDVSDASLFIYGDTVQIGSSTGGGYTHPKELVVAGNIYSTGFVEAENFRVRGSSTTALTLTSAGRVTTGENLIVTGDETVNGDLTVSQDLSVTGTATFGTTSISGFTSTGIDDNATETALTIDSNENVTLNKNSAHLQFTGESASNIGRIAISGSAAGGLFVKNYYSNSGAHFWNSGAVSLYSGNENAVTAELQIDTNGIVQVGQFSGTDFRVDTDTLAVDASADRVGINTSSPSSDLHVKSPTAGIGATLIVESNFNGSTSAGTSEIQLLMEATDSSSHKFSLRGTTGGSTTGGKLIFNTSGGSSNAGSFAFVSKANGGTGTSTTLASIGPDGIEAAAFRASNTATTTALSITDAGQVTAGEDLIVTGDETIGGDLTVSGNLTVQGTTTTIDTANLNVEDNNITLNYSTGDSSGSANGAGITIQDAVDSTTDATILWDSINDTFDFSHAIDVAGNITLSGTVDGRDIASDGTKLDGIESGADVTDATNVAAAGAVMDGDFTANGFMKRTGAGTYTVDTNTYLTSYTETDTLDSVTGRGATTTNDITVGNLTSTGIDDNATSTQLTINNTSSTFSGNLISSGDFGVGVTSPTATANFDTIQIGSGTGTGGGSKIRMGNFANEWTIQSQGGALQFYAGATTSLYMASNGYSQFFNSVEIDVNLTVDGDSYLNVIDASGKLTITNANYDNHIELNRSSEQWRFSPSTDGSLDIRRISGTGDAVVDLPKTNVVYTGSTTESFKSTATGFNYITVGSSGGTDAGLIFESINTKRYMMGWDHSADNLRWYLYNNAAGTAVNADRMTLSSTGNLGVTGNVTATAFYGDGSNLTGISSSGSFDGLTSKTGGTGTYRTSGAIQVGTSGSGMVALTVNDGGGNANVTFNHANNAPDAAGYNTGRITVNVDSTSGAYMGLSVGSGGTGPNSGLSIIEGAISVNGSGNIKKPVGNYGSINVTGAVGSSGTYSGYAINDRVVFMNNGSTTSGIYNDTNNEWFIRCVENAGTFLYYNGATELETANGYTLINNQARSPIFYDSNDTSYYCNPNSTSRLNVSYNNETSHSAEHGRGVKFWNSDSYKIYMSSTANTTWGGSASLAASSDYNMYFRMTGGTNRGFVFRNNTTAVAQIDGAGKGYFRDLQVYDGNGASTNYQNIHIGESGTGSASLHLQYRGDGYARFGMGDTSNGTAWAAYSVAQMFYTNNNITFLNIAYANGSFRAPIFYDSANTFYYADLAGTSRMNRIILTGTPSVTDVPVASLQSSSAYLDLYCETTGGGGLRLFDNQDTRAVTVYQDGGGGGGFLDNDGHWAVRVRTSTSALELRCNNNHEMSVATSYVIAYGSSRAPIFYDSANTGYYADLGATTDSIRAAGDIVAYYSDERLKDIEGNIPNALDKVCSLNGFYYRGNKKAQALGYDDSLKVGLSAQEVKEVLPEIIKDCPADSRYMTVDYAKVVPLLVEAIKDLKAEIEELKK